MQQRQTSQQRSGVEKFGGRCPEWTAVFTENGFSSIELRSQYFLLQNSISASVDGKTSAGRGTN